MTKHRSALDNKPAILRLVMSVLIVLSLASTASGQLPVLQVSLIDTAYAPGQTGVEFPVYLKNWSDSVAGFSLWIQMDQPGTATFQPTVITTGTLIDGWELIDSRHIGGAPYTLKITGLANMPAPPTTPPILPQQGQVPLVKLLLDIAPIPDTTSDRTVELIINDDNLANFNFSDPMGNSIGTIRDSLLDTAWFSCLAWESDSCIDWDIVYEEPPEYDTMVVYWDYFSYMDTASVFVVDGSITLTGGFHCGDVNGSGNELIDIADLVYLIAWMFSGGPEPQPYLSGDCNGDSSTDISDVVCFAAFMFTGGPPPACAY